MFLNLICDLRCINGLPTAIIRNPYCNVFLQCFEKLVSLGMISSPWLLFTLQMRKIIAKGSNGNHVCARFRKIKSKWLKQFWWLCNDFFAISDSFTYTIFLLFSKTCFFSRLFLSETKHGYNHCQLYCIRMRVLSSERNGTFDLQPWATPSQQRHCGWIRAYTDWHDI